VLELTAVRKEEGREETLEQSRTAVVVWY
jgi:hypothetical protein